MVWDVVGPLADATLPALQDWIAPSVFVVIGLALAAAVANQMGWWVSGREHNSALTAQGKQYDERIAEKDRQLAYIEERRKEEQQARLDDAKSFGQVAAQLQTASEDLREVEAMFSGERSANNIYGARLGSRTRRDSDPARRGQARGRNSSGD